MRNKNVATINNNDTSSGYSDIFSKHYRFNKLLLLACGLWPYQSRKGKSIQIVGLLFISFSIMGAQVRAMIGAWGRFDLIVESLTPLSANVVGFLKIFSGLVYTEEMIKIFDHIQKDWEAMRGLPQVNILERCAQKGRHWTMFYFTLVYAIVLGWYILALLPKVMDTVAPLNHSRRRFDLFPADFGVDPDYYFYPIIIFLYLSVFYQILVSVATDTLYMVIAQHACGMFEILRYRLNNIQGDKCTSVVLESNINEEMRRIEIISCIKKHKMIIEYIKSIEFTCTWKLLIITGLSTVGLSFTGYMVIVTRNNSTSMDMIRFASFSVAQVIHILYNTLPSHWIMESSSIISDTAFSCQWYMMSRKSGKLILFLIRASLTPCKITAGKIYTMSLENFSNVIRTSMSYLAVLNSVQ